MRDGKWKYELFLRHPNIHTLDVFNWFFKKLKKNFTLVFIKNNNCFQLPIKFLPKKSPLISLQSQHGFSFSFIFYFFYNVKYPEYPEKKII